MNDALDDLAVLNQLQHGRVADPEIVTRIAQYEMAYRMQASVPELTDLSDEPEHVLKLYGPQVQEKGSFAYNCLMARRLAEGIHLGHRRFVHPVGDQLGQFQVGGRLDRRQDAVIVVFRRIAVARRAGAGVSSPL